MTFVWQVLTTRAPWPGSNSFPQLRPLLRFFQALMVIGIFQSALHLALSAPVTISRTNYHGWADSIALSNGKAELIVVPAVGRVMQFRFVAEAEGPFWENRAMDGRQPDPKATEWGNFGGDKTWPSPQSDWPKIAGRGWPPPPAFDSMAVSAEIQGDQVVLTSSVDPFYGIRALRRIRLDENEPRLRISTTYEKITGEPRRVAVWVITQLSEAQGVFLLVPAASRYPNGYNKQSDQPPPSLRVTNKLLSLSRDPGHSYKIGSDAGSLLWVGQKTMVRIDSARIAGAEYPDAGSSAEIYTNPDPLRYVELEMLGPLSTLKIGDKIERTNTYTLFHRTGQDPALEAREILQR